MSDKIATAHFRVRVAEGYHSREALVFTRRQFLASLAVSLARGQSSTRRRTTHSAPAGLAVPRTPDGYPPLPAVDAAAIGRELQRRFSDLRNHFIFEYYPWYGTDPWWHWDGSGRTPPYDIAATSVPELGPYDSGNPRVLEQHARWIRESGAGAINVSWWGRGSFEDRVVPLLMDVMRDHGLKVSFHLEPYGDNRIDSYAADIRYLVTEYGDKRHWDCQLLLRSADDTEGPVFKAFATILPQFSTDCHGRTTPVAMWRPDAVWHRQTDTVRDMLRRDFARVWQLSDSTAADRVLAAGDRRPANLSRTLVEHAPVGRLRRQKTLSALEFTSERPGPDCEQSRPAPVRNSLSSKRGDVERDMR